MADVETVYVDPHPAGGWVISMSDDSQNGWEEHYKKDAVRGAKEFARGWAEEGVDVGVEVDGSSVGYYEAKGEPIHRPSPPTVRRASAHAPLGPLTREQFEATVWPSKMAMLEAASRIKMNPRTSSAGFLADGEKLASILADANQVEEAWALRGVLDALAGLTPAQGAKEAGQYAKSYRRGHDAIANA